MTNKDRKYIYFPSFSVGNLLSSVKKGFKFKNGHDPRFWHESYPEKYRHPYFLVTAGHFYKKDNFISDHSFEDTLVLGDSGGFQIASGALKWSPELRDKILNWLEANSNLAMNLDIPPKMKYQGKFQECMDLSYDNFKYFADKQSGKTDFLNVIQGTNEHEYKAWYEKVKGMPFAGWSIGGAGSSIYNFMSALVALLEGKEHHKENNKYLHVLGATKISDMYIVSQMQKSFNDVDSPMTVTTDSSTPSLAVVYGTYYTTFNIPKGNFVLTHFPKKSDDFQEFHLPLVNEWDREFMSDLITNDDVLDWNNEAAIAMILHNFYFFRDTMDTINQFVYNHPYILEQNVPGGKNGPWLNVLKSIDEMIKSDNPRLVFDRYKNLYRQMSNTKSKAKTTFNKFFK